MELDIDSRIAYLWEALDSHLRSNRISLNEDQMEFFGSMLRAAYGQGYTDALSEPYGTLQRDNGYSPPVRRFDKKGE